MKQTSPAEPSTPAADPSPPARPSPAAAPVDATSPSESPGRSGPSSRMVQAVVRGAFEGDAEFDRYSYNTSETNPTGLLDYLFAAEDEPHDPDEVFGRLRWGGQFVYVSRDRREVQRLPDLFERQGFVTARAPAYVRRPM